jgi:hypothetical protein
MTTIVNSRAMSVSGLIFGTNLVSYHCRPRARTNEKRVSIPARNGMPR